MKRNPLALETVLTSVRPMYQIVNVEGVIIISTYDKAAASICLDALNKRYPV